MEAEQKILLFQILKALPIQVTQKARGGAYISSDKQLLLQINYPQSL